MSYSISTLLTRNLEDVFGENDAARRRAEYSRFCPMLAETMPAGDNLRCHFCYFRWRGLDDRAAKIPPVHSQGLVPWL